MKKTALVLAFILSVTALTGCRIRIYPSWKNPDEMDSGANGSSMAGTWTIQTDFAAQAEIPKDVLDGFDAAMADFALSDTLAREFKPVALLGTQVVAGLNQALLCTGKSILSSDAADWYVVILYRDLQQNVSVRNVNRVVISALSEKEEAEEAGKMLAGGWTINADAAKGASLSSDAQPIFDEALKGMDGVGYSPIALLGTQVAAGINYAFLCESKVVSPSSTPSLSVVFIYKDLENALEVTRIVPFAISDYTN